MSKRSNLMTLIPLMLRMLDCKMSLRRWSKLLNSTWKLPRCRSKHKEISSKPWLDCPNRSQGPSETRKLRWWAASNRRRCQSQSIPFNHRTWKNQFRDRNWYSIARRIQCHRFTPRSIGKTIAQSTKTCKSYQIGDAIQGLNPLSLGWGTGTWL